MKKIIHLYFIYQVSFFLMLMAGCHPKKAPNSIEVLVIGEGTGAISAAIQSARSGAETILLNPLPWLGGMMTSAGVSATDGNHQLPSGLWGEFRDSLRIHYGGVDALFTGWVSNTMFEPKVGNHFWKQIASKEKNLTIHYNVAFDTIRKNGDHWVITYREAGVLNEIHAKIVIDGSDLGDIAAAAGAHYEIGMDSKFDTGELMAPDSANSIIQDLTYAAVLKDYGQQSDHTIERPIPYDPSQFYCSCEQFCKDPSLKPHPCHTMLSYGELPNNKYMINWPIKGNDYYANLVEMNSEDRQLVLEKAKQKTLQFIYFIQNELGYHNLGIANDEFPTEDGLPLMPYHREGRRVKGKVQLTVNTISSPYSNNLYKTGIAVGDYPIDHHHFERTDAPEIDFPKVPSFNIPIGVLLPNNLDNFIIADKALSVSNIVNGATRLQPVIIQIGQVAGLIAAQSIAAKKSTHQVNIRRIQEALLASSGYLMPFIDTPKDHQYFEEIQKVSASGLLQGIGTPYKWANQTWFYPDSILSSQELIQLFHKNNYNVEHTKYKSDFINLEIMVDILAGLTHQSTEEIMTIMQKNPKITDARWDLQQTNRKLNKAEIALLIDLILDPFERKINFNGDYMK